MLLVVVNDEHPHHQQAGEDAANDFGRPMKIDKSAAESGDKKKSG
jgi:hypothetical protein